MSQIVELEVILSEDVGYAVLEVEYNLLPPVPNADSDWDSRKHIDILGVTVWQEGRELDVDIDLDQVYSEISSQIRSGKIQEAFDEEEGF